MLIITYAIDKNKVNFYICVLIIFIRFVVTKNASTGMLTFNEFEILGLSLLNSTLAG